MILTVTELKKLALTLNDSPFEKMQNSDSGQLRAFLEKILQIENPRAFAKWRPAKYATVLTMLSLKEDQVLSIIRKKIQDSSKKQLTGNRPGVMCIHLSAINDKELKEIAQMQEGGVSGLQVVANQILDKRESLYTIAFSCEGDAIEKHLPNNNKVTTGESSVYVFYKPQHKLTGNANYDIFNMTP